MSLFVLLLQIHRARGKGQFDLSDTEVLSKIYRTPNSEKSRRVPSEILFTLACFIHFIEKMGLRRRLSNSQVLGSAMKESVVVGRRCLGVKTAGVLARSSQIERVEEKREKARSFQETRSVYRGVHLMAIEESRRFQREAELRRYKNAQVVKREKWGEWRPQRQHGNQ